MTASISSKQPPDISGTEDYEIVAALLGREPACAFEVVVRRDDGRPVVIANAPFFHDGTPMPTQYWLVDPGLREAVSRLEAGGGVSQAERDVEASMLSRAHARYAEERDRLVPATHNGPRPSGGVGGTARGVKCLHAHLAWWLAGGQDPVGTWVADRLALRRPVGIRSTGRLVAQAPAADIERSICEGRAE